MLVAIVIGVMIVVAAGAAGVAIVSTLSATIAAVEADPTWESIPTWALILIPFVTLLVGLVVGYITGKKNRID